jgi:hypothetical protein
MREGFSSLTLSPAALLSALAATRTRESTTPSSSLIATSATETTYDAIYYVKGALAGGIGTCITHGALTPVDVVKTRIQLEPLKYSKGMIGTFRQIIAEEGAGALLTGFGPTVVGYFIQGLPLFALAAHVFRLVQVRGRGVLQGQHRPGSGRAIGLAESHSDLPRRRSYG